MADPGRLVAGITVLVLMVMAVLAATLTKFSRNQQSKREHQAEEEAQLGTLSKTAPKPPQLPMLKTKSSLSISISPTSASPKTSHTPPSPGIRFETTTPCHQSRTSRSINSLPCLQTVLEQYEREVDAAERPDESEQVKMLDDDDLVDQDRVLGRKNG